VSFIISPWLNCLHDARLQFQNRFISLLHYDLGWVHDSSTGIGLNKWSFFFAAK